MKLSSNYSVYYDIIQWLFSLLWNNQIIIQLLWNYWAESSERWFGDNEHLENIRKIWSEKLLGNKGIKDFWGNNLET